jgi:hypothetical protein
VAHEYHSTRVLAKHSVKRASMHPIIAFIIKVLAIVFKARAITQLSY